MPGAPRAARSSRRRVVAALVVAFVTVMAGLALIDGVVLRMLRPQLRELTRIGDDHGRALAGATRLRDELGRLRRRVAATVTGATPAFDPAPDFAELDHTVARLERVCDTGVEQAALRSVRAGLERSRGIATLVEGAIARGETSRARLALDELVEHAGDVSRAADDIVRYNAEQMRAAAGEIHAVLFRAMVITSVLAVLVLVAALVLLRHAIHAVTAHAELLERHLGDMSAFAARAAHELRTPLHSLALSLGALRAQGGGGPALDRADASARRLGSTLHDILEFSRSGGAPDPGARASVASVASDVEEELRGQVADAHVVLATDVDPAIEVAVPAGHLRTILSNLLGNAVKYGVLPDGGRVTIGAHAERDRVAITIRDDGPGIAPEAIPHIFEPFYRASSRTDGYGLGLATVKRLVEAYGGRITAASERDAGTRFVLDLPRARSGRGDSPAR